MEMNLKGRMNVGKKCSHSQDLVVENFFINWPTLGMLKEQLRKRKCSSSWCYVSARLVSWLYSIGFPKLIFSCERRRKSQSTILRQPFTVERTWTLPFNYTLLRIILCTTQVSSVTCVNFVNGDNNWYLAFRVHVYD